MSKHTETPWEIQRLNHADGELWLQIGHNGYGPITEIVGGCVGKPSQWQPVSEFKYLHDDKLAEANAQHIVKCVNSHEGLVEACKAALAMFDKGHAIDRFDWGGSFLSAANIRELNEVPFQLAKAIKAAEEGK